MDSIFFYSPELSSDMIYLIIDQNWSFFSSYTKTISVYVMTVGALRPVNFGNSEIFNAI